MTSSSQTIVSYACFVGVVVLGFACGSAGRKLVTQPQVGPDNENGWLARASRGQVGKFGPNGGAANGSYGAYGGAWRRGYGARARKGPPTRYGGYKLSLGQPIQPGPAATSEYRASPRPFPSGAITGTVRMKLSGPTYLPCGPCPGGKLRNPSRGHANTVVYLENVTKGRNDVVVYRLGGRRGLQKHYRPSSGGTYPVPSRWSRGLPQSVDPRGLVVVASGKLYPYLQVVLGDRSDIVNRDQQAVPLRLRRTADWPRPKPGPRAHYDFNLRANGGKQSFVTASHGAYRLVVRGRPGAAWVVRADHPYYAMTDDRGRFRLDEVPPGKYVVHVWRPPAITGVTAKGDVIFGRATSRSRSVRVTQDRATQMTIR